MSSDQPTPYPGSPADQPSAGYPGYPTPSGYPREPGYPPGSGYPSQAGYPTQQGYPVQQGYPGAGYPYDDPAAGGARFGPAEPPAQPPAAPPGAPEQPSGPSRKRHVSRRTVAAAALVAAVVGGGVGAGTATLVADGNSSTSNASGLSYSTQSAPVVKIDGTVSAAAAKIRPSVVTIHVAATQQSDTGSGVIIRKDGYILTNNHVISAVQQGGGTITVVLADGRTAKARVIGTDPSDDLAVIKIGLKDLDAASFASSSKLVVGQTVVAVGAPLGLSDTVTSGIVSSLARPVTTSDGEQDRAVFNAIQTDAAINPGNSGGPLVNLNGDVVGINAAIATDQSPGGLLVPGQPTQAGNIGIGFAIPSDEASRIATELIRTGKATHAVMGVTVVDASVGEASTTGARVRSVNADGPADKAGMQAGDVVTKVDSQRIDDATALVAAIRSHAPGQQVQITYLRDGDSHTVTLTLGTADN